jgi:hypothetical protein
VFQKGVVVHHAMKATLFLILHVTLHFEKHIMHPHEKWQTPGNKDIRCILTVLIPTSGSVSGRRQGTMFMAFSVSGNVRSNFSVSLSNQL